SDLRASRAARPARGGPMTADMAEPTRRGIFAALLGGAGVAALGGCAPGGEEREGLGRAAQALTGRSPWVGFAETLADLRATPGATLSLLYSSGVWYELARST